MAIPEGGYLTTDNNLGTVAMTMLPGAVQFDVILRQSRPAYLAGKSPIESQDLEDRYIVALSQSTGQTRQQALGYQAANFINPADVGML